MSVSNNPGRLTDLASSLFQQMESLPALPRHLLPSASRHAAKGHQRNAEEEESTATGLLAPRCTSGTSLSAVTSN